MTWTISGITQHTVKDDGEIQIMIGEAAVRSPEGTIFPLSKCPPWGWVSLIDQGVAAPDHPYLQELRRTCKAKYEKVLQENAWQQRECMRRMFQAHDWVYCSTEAFEKRLGDEGLPADMVMLVMRARLAPESPMLAKLDACVKGLNDILDYSLTYKLSHLSIDDEHDESFNCDEIQFEMHFETEEEITYTMCLEVREGKVVFETSEDCWWDLDDLHDVWVYLFITAHHARARAVKEIDKLKPKEG